MNLNWKNKTRKLKARSAKGKADVKTLIKREVDKQTNRKIETKTINVPNPAGINNNNYVPYGALSGVQYLCTDVFKLPQGTEDSTIIGAPNRIGDKIRSIGFLMDYYFSIPNFYNVGAASFYLPYVKLRITVFTTAFGVPLLTQPLLYDTNFNANNTSTLQPVNWDEGYVKDIIYDRVHIIRNNLSVQSGGATGVNIPQSGNVMHFRKYIPYEHIHKFSDNFTTNPNATMKPVFISISAEVDDSNTGVVPSGTKILFSTGYTRAWFKDA